MNNNENLQDIYKKLFPEQMRLEEERQASMKELLDEAMLTWQSICTESQVYILKELVKLDSVENCCHEVRGSAIKLNVKYQDSHIFVYYKVEYCKKYGHPAFWVTEGVCSYCNQIRQLIGEEIIDV